jgi:hypothetical protein
MSRATLRAVLTAWLLWLPPAAGAPVHHALVVGIDPERGAIEVEDSIELGAGAASAGPVFALHPALVPELAGAPGRLLELPQSGAADVAGDALVPRRYRVQLAPGVTRFTLRYRGRIRHPLQQQGEEYARGFRETHGVIGAEGVFLSAASYWYPRFGDALLSFDLQLSLPPGWSAMTQGERVGETVSADGVREQWRCASPQEEIYLVAGRFTAYRQPGDGVAAQVLLREPDAALAGRYLDATADYIALYSALIGSYPYSKFALVENFWETGYGMPSFTLLGPKVIRFPFILHSSYPHEILHNWWGNGVYVDYATGNWAEGLTSYLADHLIKEQHGQGADYRRTVLQKYTDYVRTDKDFALTAFRSRHSASSEAVGYGKTLMLFHMLRRRLGDAAFLEGLRALYQQYRFQVADFAAVQGVFSAVAEQPLEDFFAQWVERRGAPALRVSAARAARNAEGYVLRALLEQTQSGPAYALRVPLAVQLEGQASAWQTDVPMERKRSAIELALPARPLALHVDPEFDVFRRLHRAELPPAISQALGAERVLIVLPSLAPAPLQDAYRALAESWQADNPEQRRITTDAQLEELPADRTVWLFGWRNRFRDDFAEALDAYAFADQGERVRIGQTELSRERHAAVIMARRPANPEQAFGWLAADDPAALPGLGRKLPHYGRYSYLGFSGAAPENMLKGQWPVVDSPLSVRLATDAPRIPDQPALRLTPREPLAAPAARFSRERLRRNAAFLAGEALAGRGLGSAGLERAAEYIAAQFRDAGLQPGGDGEDSYFQVWRQRVDVLDDSVTLKNVIGILPGSDPRLAGESLVIGAHYDHFGRGVYADYAQDRGRLHPGADDNASGVAVMLELARVLAGQHPPRRSIVFVAFSAEETGRLGSRHYVQNAGAYPADGMIAMLNLDSVGRLGARPVTLFGTGSAAEWPYIFRGAGHVTGVAVQPVAEDFGSSDQSSFIAAGVPAVQLFGGVHADLHRPGDTLDKLDFDGMLKITALLCEAVDHLAARTGPLSSTLTGSVGKARQVPVAKRRVSFGTVPDFAFAGAGVRVEDVRAASPAARAGLRAGDVIIAVNGTPVDDLRGYAAALKRLDPGDEIRVRFRRGGQERDITARVVQR